MEEGIQLDNTRLVGEWLFVQNLGKGGFGKVDLYHNALTNSSVAIKQCIQDYERIPPKTKERWIQECNIMQKLNHPNIVLTAPLPVELNLHTGPLPVLCLEYCSLGDLRKVISRPENINGMPEYQVRSIANDLASGLEYLHSNKIVHRDLKPENIMLKETENRVIYKIIDLGYAKELNQETYFTSLVGTLQYQAPELFTNTSDFQCTKKVDLWSLGTTIFECITGFRPFVHNAPFGTWLEVVKLKKDQHIYAFLNNDKKITYSETFPPYNLLSKYSQNYFEQWLKVILKFNPIYRGVEVNHQRSMRPKCFDMLDKILKNPLVCLLDAALMESIILPATENNTPLSVASLSDYLFRAHRIIGDHFLITGSGELLLDGKREVLNHCLDFEAKLKQEHFDLFLFYRSSNNVSENHNNNNNNRRAYLTPLNFLQENRNKEYQISKQIYFAKHLIHFCSEKQNHFNRLSEAYDVITSCSKIQFHDLSDTLEAINSNLNTIRVKSDFFKESLEFDFKQLDKEKASSEIIADSWRKMLEKVELINPELQFNNLKEIENMLNSISYEFQSKSHNLRRNIDVDVMKSFRESSEKLLRELLKYRQIGNNDCNNSIVEPILELYNDCDKVSRDVSDEFRTFVDYFIKYLNDVRNIKSRCEEVQEDFLNQIAGISKFQLERQKVVWALKLDDRTMMLDSNLFDSNLLSRELSGMIIVRSDSFKTAKELCDESNFLIKSLQGFL